MPLIGVTASYRNLSAKRSRYLESNPLESRPLASAPICDRG
ncbi:hypothetical protein pYptb0027 (plasmid) [Yersinia pseudotuberculosis IP 32953]|uniref:Uncharacterized protein n=1 Tax=Yersinia pseudotuberculosis serotype I (strain IP32953) TaxID=273123 RepID=Q663C7_YERPS|nr:hypothetical protein pYptb0027 [Yersinia pseudotuberculosis IP 32953]